MTEPVPFPIKKPSDDKSYLFLSLITAGPGMFLALIVMAVVYAELRIAPLFSGHWTGSYTTWMYSAPHRFHPGGALGEVELARRLERLKYAKVAEEPRDPGTYRVKDGRFDIYLRNFSHPTVSATPGRFELVLGKGRIRSLKRLHAGAAREAVLEPELLFEVSGDKMMRREPIRYEEIPDEIKLAAIAIEDRRFYQHPGVDLRGIARAAVRNFHVGRVSQGGSTLTQQLARNLFLTQKRTLPRKLTEVLIAFYMESRLPKDQIMRMYLDSVYFGQTGTVSIVGLVAASKYFFDKRPPKLTLAECALLAGMLQSPRLYNPFENPDAALRRRNVVLEAMLRAGFITPAQEEKAKTEKLRLSLAGQYEPREADYFVSYIQRLWEKRYVGDVSLTQGIRIYTTLDPWLQERAQEAVKKARYEAALVALEPGNGAIRALVGGKDFASSPFDRATQAQRQPGSAFKPFVYGAALEAGPWTPESKLSDRAKSYRTPTGLWTPKNYDGWYRGDVTLTQALAHSLNGATVRLAHELGPDKAIDYARKLGIVSALKPDLGLALGVYEVNLLEITGAYCAFANGGRRVEPYGIEAALDRNGQLLERHEPRRENVLSKEQARQMTGILREVVLTGTAKDMKKWDLQGLAAGKTGTTDEGKDAWFVGYTPRVAAGVWVGSDLPAKLDLSGAGAALPIWADFVRSGVHAEPLEAGTEPVVPAAPAAEAAPSTAAEKPGSGFSSWLHRLFHRE